jgi:hypothetical protein
LGMRCASRDSPLPKTGLFSPGVGGLKIPKFPMVALLGVAPQGDTGPLPRTLPAVLLRIRGPRGKLGLESSARSSLPSLKSLVLREK